LSNRFALDDFPKLKFKAAGPLFSAHEEVNRVTRASEIVIFLPYALLAEKKHRLTLAKRPGWLIFNPPWRFVHKAKLLQEVTEEPGVLLVITAVFEVKLLKKIEASCGNRCGTLRLYKSYYLFDK
jgi:hypothetical protein